jgi:hypothetical protein
MPAFFIYKSGVLRLITIVIDLCFPLMEIGWGGAASHDLDFRFS